MSLAVNPRPTYEVALRPAPQQYAPFGKWQGSVPPVLVYVLDERSSPGSLLGNAVDTFVRRADAERFIEDVREDDPQLASYLRIEERELEAGGLNT